MLREAKDACLKPLIIAFALAICCIVLNPCGKDIRCTEKVIKKTQLNAKYISSKNDIMDIQYNSRDVSNANDYDDNNIEVHSEDDIDEDVRLFE
ncbi:15523_t:CDS:2 [Dentiscutata erythropus]|uniref:15523_t:CDS:1 n=1 Tax=Dentiscutata erythropus TaxID=1348616 RepID=A0A9N9G2W5_9GLOM|nr:15523_t:CDS:2 [Dentiscutata erythropus]